MSLEIHDLLVPQSAYFQATHHNFMNRKTREKIAAKLIVVDGLPPSAVCRSEFICQPSVIKVCFFLKSLNHVMQLVHKQYEIAKEVAMVEMQNFWKSVIR